MHETAIGSAAWNPALFLDHPVPMWLCSTEGGSILAANRAAVRRYGYDLKEFKQRAWKDLVDDPQVDVSRGGFERHRGKAGSGLDVRVTTQRLEIQGRPVWLKTAEDLTALSHTRELVARRDEAMRALVDAMTDVILVTGVDHRILHANGHARRLFGEDAACGALSPLGCRNDTTQGGEIEWIDSAGYVRILSIRVSPIEWDGSHAVLLALHDVTGGRATEQGLILGRRAMEWSANGIVMADALDPAQPLIYVNPAFERITGYRRGDALGRNWSFLTGDDVDQPELSALKAALHRGEDAKVVLRNYRKDGTPFWNEVSFSPVRNPSGTVTHFVGILNDITERRRHEAETLRRSTHDDLTDLPNRMLMLDELRDRLADGEGQRDDRLGALLIDLDQFKEINDALGHDKGDQVLCEAALRLKACLGAGQMLGRLSGDEFLAVAREKDAEAPGAIELANRMLETIARPYLIDGQTVYCSCSIGVAFAEAADDEPVQMLRRADVAVHAAKRSGRNAVRLFSSDLAQRFNDRLELRTRLQKAIEQAEFELHYQPQLDLHRKRVSGVEALVRWRHPERGLLSPGNFIEVAEETGQIVAIGEWILEEACRQHRRWLESGLLDCPVSVNVSAIQFRRPGLVDTVADVLRRTGLPAHRLELELTESVMMDDAERTLQTFMALRKLGVSLSIDDFGTGYSSLGYLKRLPIDKIKIDRSFIRDITHDGDDAAITLSVIAMAHHLRLRVVAEGVETPAQMTYLQRHRCDEIQGFHVSRPLPTVDLERLLSGSFPQQLYSDRAAVPAARTLLLVDDEPNILRALSRVLRRDGYRILTAGSADEAFQVLAEQEVQVILSDQRMPLMCGTDFLSEVKRLYPQTVRIVLSGYTDLQSVTEAINRGAIYRFLTKPWEDEILRRHIREAFNHVTVGEEVPSSAG